MAPGFTTRAASCLTGQEGGTGYAAGRAAIRFVFTDNLEATIIGDITNQDQEVPAETLLYAGTAPKVGPTGATALQSPGVVNLTIPTTNGAFLPYDSSRVPAMIPRNIYSSYATFCLPPIPSPGYSNFAIPGLGNNFNEGSYCTQPRQKLNSWGAQATVQWTINDTMTLKNIFAQRAYSSSWSEDNDASPWPIGLGADGLSHHQTSEELRLNGKAGALLDYTVGAFYFRELSVYNTHQDLWYPLSAVVVPGLGPAAGFLNFIQDDPVVAHDKAGYLHTVWHLLPKLDVTLAGRYTSQDKDYNYVRLNPSGGTGGSATLVGSLNGATGHYSASRWDYRAALNYRFTDQLMAYGQVSTGFKGGGVDPRPFYVQQAISFKPEALTNYELGVKSSWLDNHLRVNIDGYFSQYRDIQLALLNCGFVPSIAAATAAAHANGTLPPTSSYGSPCALPYNGGAAHVKGVELETQARFGGLAFDASGSYLDFKYVNLNPNSGVDLGMVTPFTPKWQGNAGVQYTVPVGSAGSITGRLDASTRSEIWTNAVNDQYNRIGGFTTYNAHLTWDAAQGNWQVGLQALNLSGKRYFLNIFDLAAAGGGSVAGNPGAPLELDLEVKHTM